MRDYTKMTGDMNIKPILFNTEMVRAILDGRKTVTRRVVKLPKSIERDLEFREDGSIWWQSDGDGYGDGGRFADLGKCVKYFDLSPYRPGDILYVRETFRIDYLSNIIGTERVHYKADGSFADIRFAPNRYDMMRRAQLKPGWRPNENMPKEAARIFLKITEVGVQQVKGITDEEAASEGFALKSEFISAFLRIYPDCTEDSWCWVIRFERIKKPPL